MPATQPPDITTPEELLRALQRGGSLFERFRNRPIELAEHLGLKLPEKPVAVMQRLGVYDPERHGPITPGLRDLVYDVCMLEVLSAVVVANRGGGKSLGVSFIEFYLWMLLHFDALNLGGSELQADQVYQYLLGYVETDAEWSAALKKDPLQSKTEKRNGAWIRVLTASQKSVRSPHAGGVKRDGRIAGGLLVIDEEAECERDIVEAALSTINTARPSVNVRCSTFHNAIGTFADCIDNHEAMGYKMYQWDIFDVADRCECTGGMCQSPEPCFREDHTEDYIDPEDDQLKQRLVHRAYCGGRAAYADGWVPMSEIETLWRRMKRNHSRWEVEAMGSRPTTAGHVIKDLTAFARNTVESDLQTLYLPGAPVTVCVDWGANAAGLTVWQEQMADQHVLLHAELLIENGLTQIVSAIVQLWRRYPDCIEVAADIGGGGNYLNPHLRDVERLPVRDVAFNESKEAAVAAWNVYNEADKCKYPAEFADFTRQVRAWQRINGRIQKGDDHLCDSSICYFAKFVDRLGLNNIRILPRSFNTAIGQGPVSSTAPGASHSRPTTAPRLPIMGGFSRTRRS